MALGPLAAKSLAAAVAAREKLPWYVKLLVPDPVDVYTPPMISMGRIPSTSSYVPSKYITGLLEELKALKPIRELTSFINPRTNEFVLAPKAHQHLNMIQALKDKFPWLADEEKLIRLRKNPPEAPYSRWDIVPPWGDTSRQVEKATRTTEDTVDMLRKYGFIGPEETSKVFKQNWFPGLPGMGPEDTSIFP